MKSIHFVVTILIIWSCNTPEAKEYVIAIGSCNRTDLPQDIWPAINSNSPDLFIWLGDIVYGDTHDMSLLRSKYDKLKNEEGYQSLIKNTDIIGVWDDHDYGWNDAGKYYNKKDSSKMILTNFLDIPADDPIKSRDGMYSSYTLEDGMIKIILLDARYFRDTVIHDPSPDRRYTINPDGDILGEIQWEWLKSELQSSSAKINVIGSGVQIISEEHGYEKWANFPKSRKRFFDLLNELKPPGLILLSGDRHIAEISELSISKDYTVTEFTSSGLTHTWSTMGEESNKYRLGEKVVKRNFGIIRIQSMLNKISVNLEIRGLADSLYKEHKIIVAK